MSSISCTNPHCVSDTHPRETYTGLFGGEHEDLVFAPTRADDDGHDEPAVFRMYPIIGGLPEIELNHCGIGNSLKHYIGHEEVPAASIEYRAHGSADWLDADSPGQPAWREQPPLTEAQVRDLIRDRSDLKDVPYAEPLVFLAYSNYRNNFWGRAVAAGWAPTAQDLQLIVDACGVRASAAPRQPDHA